MDSCEERADPDSFDVAIVGGRPAGASLALRLGAAGMKVLVVDRASFPSRPAVSAPFLLPHALQLLDELDLQEQVYAAQTPVLKRIVLELAGYFRTEVRFDDAVGGRNHFYAVDRARLDGCLWRALSHYPTVTAHSGATFVGVTWGPDKRVDGLRVKLGHASGERRFGARVVVGADGRHSALAAAVGARVTLQRTDVETSLYYAHWRDVSPYADGHDDAAHIHTSCDGFSFVFMPSADGETMVVAQGRSDRYLAQPGSPQEVYMRLLQERPHVARRLRGATQVSELYGIKRMGNLFRTAYGPGWVLVGDAYHQKDSLDAQGIYDALLGAKLLAEQLIAWDKGRRWEQALSAYETAAYAALKPMFDATAARLQRELYSSPPAFVIKSLLRWVLTHPDYTRRFARVATRTLAPEQLMPTHELLRLAVSGAVRQFQRSRQLDPTDVLRV